MSEPTAPVAAPADALAPAPASAAEAPPAPSGKTEPTPRGAIDRAFAAVDKAAEAPNPVESKPEATPETQAKPGERQRGPDGKFLAAEVTDASKAALKPTEAKPAEVKPEAKPLTNFIEPPNRFSPDAKTAWKDAPEPVRAEIHRAVRELEAGIEKYRGEIAEFEPLKAYSEQAKKEGTNLKNVIDDYARLARGLRSGDPMPAINELLGFAGLNLRDLAAAVMGQKPDQMASQTDATIRDLRNQVAQLTRQMQSEIGEVKTNFQKQQAAELERTVSSFATEKDASGTAKHPRFDELSEDIVQQLKSGYDLPTAYKRAELLNPIATPPPVAPAAASAAAPDAPTAQNRDKGSLSVTGAPSSGSDPLNRKPPSTRKEAIDRAFDSVGLS